MIEPPDRTKHEHGARGRAALFVVASVGLVGFVMWAVRSDGVGPFLHAALVNAVVVAWSAFVLPLRGLPPFDEYYALRRWERSGRVYFWLGVPLFRELIRHGPLSFFNRALPAAWHSGDPERIERETRAAEGGHAAAFLIVMLLAVAALVRGEPERAGWLVAFDVPMNLYPVLLQRDHRHRLREMIRAGTLAHAGASPHAATRVRTRR